MPLYVTMSLSLANQLINNMTANILTLNYLYGYCSGFGWNRVSFHKTPVGLTQTSQSNGIFDTM